MAEGESPIGPAAGGPQPHGIERGPDEGQIQTFLIADVRGYTRFSQEHGDEAAGRLAARFADLTTQVIAAAGGTVLELRGDEALCIFSTTRRSIRAAIELQARYLAETTSDPTMPFPVGIGIDTGEAVPVAGGFRGRALNLAARLCGAAKAGEILATREAIHLAGQMDGVHVEDRGVSSFKNIAEPVSVMRITGEGEDTAHWFAEHFAPPVPTRRARGRRSLVIAALTTLLVAAIAIPLLDSRGSASTVIASNSVGVLDPDTGELLGTPLGFDDRPGSIAASEDAVWVTHPDAGTVTTDRPERARGARLDPGRCEPDRDRGRVRRRVGRGERWALRFSHQPRHERRRGHDRGGERPSRRRRRRGKRLGDQPIRRNDLAHRSRVARRLIETIPVGLDPEGIAVGFGSVWVGLAGSSKVVRVDPRTDSVTQQIGVGNGPGSLDRQHGHRLGREQPRRHRDPDQS